MKLDRHIYLLGFMGSGKSTIGPLLAEKLSIRFIDLDEYLVMKTGRSIPDIFSRDGEDRFRDLESQYLQEVSTATGPSVIATGGGIVERAANIETIRDRGISVYLECAWEIIIERLAAGSGRPLADSEDDWASTRSLLESRVSRYRSADLTVQSGPMTAEETVATIIEQLENK